MSGKNPNSDCYLGLDLSTQSLTAVLIENASGGIERFSIDFDEVLPSYGTAGGILPSDDPAVAHSDPRMWAEALDCMLQMLAKRRLTERIAAVSVSAQQHGTVYLNASAAEGLRTLDPREPIAGQISNLFSRPTSPVWMDISTTEECREMTEALDGNLNVAQLTGSIATERFMGPQVRKFWKESPDRYKQTAHIALISSYLTGLLIGNPAPVDAGDGFGTNLANVRTGKWSRRALAAAAPGLYRRLPALFRKDQAVGFVSGYWVKRCGFRPDAVVDIGSGDNPCSLVGLGMIGTIDKRAVSLGTSDTCFGYMPDLPSAKRSEGHIFGSADGRYMALICHRNGSLARERIKERFGLSWNDFSQILLKTRPGNSGKIMLPYFSSEITPKVIKPGVRRFGGLEEDDPAANVRGLVEGQVMSMYLHSRWVGKRPELILVTAGGSKNPGILNVIAQVFNARVQTFEIEDSAAWGAALRAASLAFQRSGQTTGEKMDWQDLFDALGTRQKGEYAEPVKEDASVYHGENGLLDVYEACENFVLHGGSDPGEKIGKFKNCFG